MSTKPPAKEGQKPKPSGKKSLLLEYVDKRVNVITNDGRNVTGTLRGFDQVCNVILEKSIERIFSQSAGVETVTLGLYIIRGDNIAVLGEIDQEQDAKVPWHTTKVRDKHLRVDFTIRCSKLKSNHMHFSLHSHHRNTAIQK